MYFLSLEIQNIRCFGQKQRLDLRDSNGALAPWTLLLGDNGVGKTTLLECLTWMRPVEEPEKKKKRQNKTTIKPFMDGFDDNTEYERLFRTDQKVESKVGAQLTNGVNLKEIPSAKDIVSHATVVSGLDGKLIDVKSEYAYLPEFNEPNLFAYGASRHMAINNLERTELDDPISNLSSESGDLYDAEQVLLNLDYNALKEGKSSPASNLLRKVKKLLVELLPEIHDESSIKLFGSRQILKDSNAPTGVRIQMPYGDVPLYSLSLGYKTMIAWTIDLALRMLSCNPDCESPLEQPAVVLVDEIDLHLHPKWQRGVRGYLTEHFPKTQFICTAHSPLMAQSSENISVLKRVDNEVYIENRPSIVEGWRIGQILTSELFEVSSERSNEIEDLVKARRDILAKKKQTPEDKRQLEVLDNKLLKLPIAESEGAPLLEADQLLLDRIRKTAEFLSKKGKLK